MKTVLAFGTFDGLHKGHASYLRQAKRLGDRLVVVVARDATVRKLKKRRPRFGEGQRLRAMRRLRVVDRALLGTTRSPYAVLRTVRPQVIALGYDQKFYAVGLRKKMRALGLRARIVRCKPFKPEVYHSALLRTVRRKAEVFPPRAGSPPHFDVSFGGGTKPRLDRRCRSCRDARIALRYRR